MATEAASGNEPLSPRRRRRPELTPTQRAIGSLSRREHSRLELARKLAARGVDPEQAREVVDRLASKGWQDDMRFAQSLLRSRASNGYGPIRIRSELATHGFDRDAIALAMQHFEGDWVENAGEVVRRRFGNVPLDAARRRRIANFLIGRGFAMDQVHAVIGLATASR